MDYATFKALDSEELLVLCVDVDDNFKTGDDVKLLDKVISTSNMVEIVSGEYSAFVSIEQLEIANW